MAVNGVVAPDCAVVDEDIDRPERRSGFLHHAGDLGFVATSPMMTRAAPSQRLDFTHRIGCLLARRSRVTATAALRRSVSQMARGPIRRTPAGDEAQHARPVRRGMSMAQNSRRHIP